MTTYEILTIILTVFSGIVAVSAILVPIILNYQIRRQENKKNSPKVKDKLMFKEYKLKYLNLVDELTLNFSKYITSLNNDDKAILLSTIYKLIMLSNDYPKELLYELINRLQNQAFNQSELTAQLTKFLENISEEDFEAFWNGCAFFNSHKGLFK